MNPSRPIPVGAESSEQILPLSGGGCGFVRREWKPVFEKAGLRTLEEFFSASGKALSKPGLGKRYRAQMDYGDATVFYKRYHGESLRNRLQRWLEDGKRNAIACREVDVARALEKIGIATFQPLAWGWTKNPGVAQKSFVVMSQVPGTSVERWLGKANLNWRKKIQLAEDLARFAKRLHESGWFHRDFYLCHIFIVEKEGKFQLALVDLARMFRPRWRVERWQIKDLAQLNFSVPEYFSRATRLRFAKTYLGVERFSPAHKALLRKITRRSQNIALRERRRQQRDNSG